MVHTMKAYWTHGLGVYHMYRTLGMPAFKRLNDV